MSDKQIDYRAIQERVERRVKERSKFIANLGSYVFVNLLLWGIYFFSSGGERSGFPWPLFVTLFWGIGLVQQGFKIFMGNSFLENMRNREMEREIAKERQRLYGDPGYDDMESIEKRKRSYSDEIEKPKNRSVHLSDDGELIDDEDLLHTTSNRGR